MHKSNASAVGLPSSYSPLGCNKPVMTHLTAEENIQLRKLAKSDLRSVSATVRMFIVEGLERRSNRTE